MVKHETTKQRANTWIQLQTLEEELKVNQTIFISNNEKKDYQKEERNKAVRMVWKRYIMLALKEEEAKGGNK